MVSLRVVLEIFFIIIKGPAWFVLEIRFLKFQNLLERLVFLTSYRYLQCSNRNLKKSLTLYPLDLFNIYFHGWVLVKKCSHAIILHGIDNKLYIYRSLSWITQHLETYSPKSTYEFR